MTQSKITKGLYVDDIRDKPSWCVGDWHVARNYEDAIDMLSTHEYDEVSLDHDIASFDPEDGREYTGYDIALWLAERKMDGRYVPPKVYCHSANPVGVKRILGVIERYLGPDDCEICLGAKGGVKGNENIIDGIKMCDYCHSERLDGIKESK